MKIRTKNLIGIIAATLAAGILILAGCAPADDQESIEDVIKKFVSAVNDDNLLDVQECLDREAIDYNTILTDVFFINSLPNKPYSVGPVNEKSGNYATAKLTPNGVGTEIDLYFQLRESDDTFYIQRIWLGPNDSYPILFE